MPGKSAEKEREYLKKLEERGGTVLKTSHLLDILEDYRNPKSKIHSWIQSGILTPLSKGVYILAPDHSQNALSNNLVSNLLYGPSYISRFTAMSWHGMIPEAVFTTEAVTFLESRTFTNTLGTFQYTHIPEQVFSNGIWMDTLSNGKVFWIASPTKALCDAIYCERNLRIHSAQSLRSFMEEFWRIDTGSFELDKDIVETFIQFGVKKEIYSYLKYLNLT
jgi:hypothetical protein